MENFEYKFIRADNKVIALSSFAGKTVRGVAKCHPGDVFDIEYGKQLAAARCGRKIAEKRYKRANDKYYEIARRVLEVDKEFHEACDYLTNSYDKLKRAFDLENSLMK